MSQLLRESLKIGLLINPYAGIGGPSGQKGSDDLDAQSRESLKSMYSRSSQRADVFLDTVASAPLFSQERFLSKNSTQKSKESSRPITLVFCEGEMGGVSVRHILASNPQAKSVFACSVLDVSTSLPTTSADSISVIKAMLEDGIDILIFVGGDGTARDVFDVLPSEQLVLGVPAGVKMHSGVFAIDSRAAAEVFVSLCEGKLVSTRQAEVRDIDENLLRLGKVNARFYGELRVPEQHEYIQAVKQGGLEVEELVLLDIAEDIRERIELLSKDDLMVIFAPGTTCHFVAKELGFDSTLLGFDVMKGGEIIANDVDALQLEPFIKNHRGEIRLLITPIGGQGHLIGRGNQQLTPSILLAIRRERLWVVSTKLKLEALDQRPLNIDSNDPLLDQQWSGFIPVITGFHDEVIYRIGR